MHSAVFKQETDALEINCLQIFLIAKIQISRILQGT